VVVAVAVLVVVLVNEVVVALTVVVVDVCVVVELPGQLSHTARHVSLIGLPSAPTNSQ
jgi:hypothetical protein